MHRAFQSSLPIRFRTVLHRGNASVLGRQFAHFLAAFHSEEQTSLAFRMQHRESSTIWLSIQQGAHRSAKMEMLPRVQSSIRKQHSHHWVLMFLLRALFWPAGAILGIFPINNRGLTSWDVYRIWINTTALCNSRESSGCAFYRTDERWSCKDEKDWIAHQKTGTFQLLLQ